MSSVIANNELLQQNAADAATQEARINAIKNKTCLWVTAPVVPMMSKTLMDRMKRVVTELQVKVCAVFHSEEDPLYKILKENNLFESCLFVDLYSEDAGKLIMEKITQDEIQIDSAFSPYEQCQTIVGAIATELNIPMANPESAYQIARSKNVTREVCREAGIAMPKSALCNSIDQVEAALEDIGYPAIMKPSSGAGSAGVHKVYNKEQALEKFNLIIEDIKSNWALSWNPGCESSCLIEEFLIGDEFDVDMLVWDNKLVYAASVDNWACMSEHFLESGSNQPSLYPREKTEKLEQYALDCVNACGFKGGCFHVECIYTEEGPRLVEVNARQGGGSNQVFNKVLNDVDIFENFFISTFGVPINPPVKPTGKAMADYSFTCEKTGVILDTKVMDELKDLPGVIHAASHVKAGQKVTGFDTGFPMWLGEMQVCKDTPEECIALIKGVIDTIQFNIVSEEEFERISLASRDDENKQQEQEKAVKKVDPDSVPADDVVA